MSDQIDISREACNEMTSRLYNLGEYEVAHLEGYSMWPFADMILALRAALDAAEASDATKAAIIDDQLNRMAQLEQDLHEAHEALNIPNRYAYKCGVAFGKASAEADKARAVAAERERCAAVVLSYCGTSVDGLPYYIDLNRNETEEMFAALRAEAKP